jgi:hypothetical protein
MERFERRPMQPEERAMWTRSIATVRAQPHFCKTCGQPAVRLLGSLERGTWYCAADLAVAINRAERAAMRSRR